MTIRVLLFAAYRDLAGTDVVELPLEAPSTVGAVLDQLRAAHPGTRALPNRPLVAVNQVHARLDAPVRAGDELALLPPLAGG